MHSIGLTYFSVIQTIVNLVNGPCNYHGGIQTGTTKLKITVTNYCTIAEKNQSNANYFTFCDETIILLTVHLFPTIFVNLNLTCAFTSFSPATLRKILFMYARNDCSHQHTPWTILMRGFRPPTQRYSQALTRVFCPYKGWIINFLISVITCTRLFAYANCHTCQILLVKRAVCISGMLVR